MELECIRSAVELVPEYEFPDIIGDQNCLKIHAERLSENIFVCDAKRLTFSRFYKCRYGDLNFYEEMTAGRKPCPNDGTCIASITEHHDTQNIWFSVKAVVKKV